MSTASSCRSTSVTERLGVWAGCAALALLTACSATAPTTGYEHFNEVDVASHMRKVGLGPGDLFEVNVYDEPSLSRPHRVSPSGHIRFPHIGRLLVKDLNPDEIAEKIRTRLADGYLRDPYVSVLVKEYNSKKVFVLGEVHKPGTFVYTADMNVVGAITLAGGFKPSANKNYVVVARKIDGRETQIPVPVEKISEARAPNLMLRAGDIVFVPDKLL